MTGFLVLLGFSALLYLLALPRVPPGIKVVVLTAPPVVALMWLVNAVFDRRAVAAGIGAVYLVVLVALNGLVGHPRLPAWTKLTVFATVPVTALAWLLVVTADDTLKDPGEDPCTMRYGGVGVSEVFPPRAYCRYEGGGTHDLATGAQFVFWVCFVVSLVLLTAGLWQVARDPKTLLRQFRRPSTG
ncbi:hypothetical protein [Streptomyces chartreusis]|uniref:hypothetical protein n=1 Tax=Streptomyces chartreusis TaxID=1969 RepID=UPI00123E2072|nr:hypothetical protein [Streptomyces chartreusis]QEV69829.1 hypothetical protein CP983_26415 [Streptomyces chartreusis]GGX48496.1 hypothetical protein GCM10010321_76770 [Streptomyces chartreusis]